MENTAAIWWIRRDLRLHDNPALQAALHNAQEVIPLFIADPHLIYSPATAPQRLAFLWEGLRSLDQELKRRGSRLILHTGIASEILQKMLAETGAEKIFAQPDYSPYALRRDRPLDKNLPVEWTGSQILHPPFEVLKNNGTPYTIFTPYMLAWKEKPLPTWRAVLKTPEHIHTREKWHSEPIPEAYYAYAAHFPATEKAARLRLEQFTSGDAPIYNYRQTRDLVVGAGTSHLSPYLRFGLLSTRHVVLTALDAAAAAQDAEGRSGAETWLNQLIWREFYVSILYHFPQVLERSFHPELQAVPWRNDEHDFRAWQEGGTGFPVVDAGMRELVARAWMHNRARMICASFLVKNLLIDWRWGERWFMQHLLDGDPAANNGGWQWTAGTGTDAAPYFQIFNPILQSNKFDPHGHHIRQWVPELKDVPDQFIHTPWAMPLDIQQTAGCMIGKDYPTPIVDLATSRVRALQAYALAKDHFANRDSATAQQDVAEESDQ